MVIYEITAVVEPSFIEQYEQYMRERHIPDLLATGYFTGASFAKSKPGRHRVRYEASTRGALDRYLTTPRACGPTLPHTSRPEPN